MSDIPYVIVRREPKWTPGTWEIVRRDDDDSLVICTAPDGNWRICFMATPGDSPRAMQKIEADAHLIASAPDLYAACESALDALEGLALNVDTNPWCKELRSALARARGETT